MFFENLEHTRVFTAVSLQESSDLGILLISFEHFLNEIFIILLECLEDTSFLSKDSIIVAHAASSNLFRLLSQWRHLISLLDLNLVKEYVGAAVPNDWEVRTQAHVLSVLNKVEEVFAWRDVIGILHDIEDIFA